MTPRQLHSARREIGDMLLGKVRYDEAKVQAIERKCSDKRLAGMITKLRQLKRRT